MKERLLNLFAHKRNSAALVGLVLIATLLAGGLVACEKADASAPTGSGIFSAPTIMPQDQANRELLEMYFYENFHEDECSVVLADLTGDGLEEMLVLTMHTTSDAQANLRQPVGAEEFAYGGLTIYGVKEGSEVFPYESKLGDVANAHAGWGYMYLVPRSDGNGFALLDFRPFSGQGMASYFYNVDILDEQSDAWLSLDSGDAFFSLGLPDLMGPDTGDDVTPEEAQAFLDRVQAYRDSGVPLLVYDVTYGSSPFETEFAYLNAPPADAFAGKLDTLSALRGCVVSNGGSVTFPLPPTPPASPEEAMDLLEASLGAYPDGYVFRIPNYKGEWNIHIAGRMRMGGEESDDYMSVHYLEGETWTPGKRYSFEVAEGAYFKNLTLFAFVTAPDGTEAERDITLAGPQNEVDSDLPDNDPAAIESAQALLAQLQQERRETETAMSAARQEMERAQADLKQLVKEHREAEAAIDAARHGG